jgi:hypothetical protein
MSEDNKGQAAGNEKPSEELSTEDLKQVAGGVKNPAVAEHKDAQASEAYIKQ